MLKLIKLVCPAHHCIFCAVVEADQVEATLAKLPEEIRESRCTPDFCLICCAKPYDWTFDVGQESFDGVVEALAAIREAQAAQHRMASVRYLN